MKIDAFDPAVLTDAFGIDMSTIDLPGVTTLGAGWGRVTPGTRSQPHQHDEIEMFVIVSGSGEVVVDGARHPVGPGTVIKFDPFETHTLDNPGDVDIVFATVYWRDAPHAKDVAARSGRRRFADRPVFVFSTPPTPNGDLHLGHLSGPYLGADAFVRFQRMNGARAWHLTGSDDFQSYVVARAGQEESTPERVAAHYSAEIARTLELMDIPIDQYTVTSTDPGYREGVRRFFGALVDSGAVKRRELPALLDGETGRYLYEVDVGGTCPACSAGTNGNICEECGEPNIAADLIGPRSKLSGSLRAGTVQRFALALHEFGDVVADHHRLGRVPPRLRELAKRVFARESLDLPVSHPAQWGVPPPGVDDEVVWVWPEMSYGFLHGIAELGAGIGETWRADKPEQDWKIVHFFGYDNSFYHAILYPVLYRLAFPDWEPDIDYHLNEFYLLEGKKFSTSRRHAVWGRDILTPRTVDAVRFFLARSRPEGARTNFDAADYIAAVNEVLIGGWQSWLDDLGRRLNERYGGVVPDAGIWTPEHTAFLARLGARLAAVTASLGPDGFSLRAATADLEGIVADARSFADHEEVIGDSPGWDSERRTAIALELAAARLLSRVAAPIMPRFAGRLAGLLGAAEGADGTDGTERSWPTTVDLVPAGTRVDLTGQEFFAAAPPPPAPGRPEPRELGWLADVVRATLDLPPEADVAGKTLHELGLSSLQAVAVQYQIVERFDLDISINELFSDRNIADLARLLAKEAAR